MPGSGAIGIGGIGGAVRLICRVGSATEPGVWEAGDSAGAVGNFGLGRLSTKTLVPVRNLAVPAFSSISKS